MASPYPKFEKPFFEEKIIIDFLIRFFSKSSIFSENEQLFSKFRVLETFG